MTITADRAKYFWLAANDPVTATEPEPSTFDASIVTPCIDLAEYMQKFRAALALVGTDPDPANNSGDFIYIASWWLGLLGGTFAQNSGFTAPGSGLGSAGPFVEDLDAFDLDPLGSEERLIDTLKGKALVGVEVRVLGWVSYSLLSTGIVHMPLTGLLINQVLANSIQHKDPGGLVSLNAQTMNSVKNLRAEPKLAKGTILNVTGHSAGGVHLKMAMVGTKPDALGKSKMIGFTGGLDFVEDRWADYMHRQQPGWDPLPDTPRWHDIQVAVEGKAAQAVYDHFRASWNENLRRKAKRFYFEGERMYSYVEGTEAIPPRSVELPLLSTAATPTHHVQSLRTVPAFNYRWYNCLPEGEAAAFAPDGLFEVRAAWRKAILAAEQYVYIEDQSYWSREVFEWINKSIRSHPDLKVVCVMSGQGDPNDAPLNDREIMHNSINVGLLGLGTADELTPAQQDRIRMFRIWGEYIRTTNLFEVKAVIPDAPGYVFIETDHIYVVDPAAKAPQPLPANAYANQNFFVSKIFATWHVVGNLEAAPGTAVTFRIATPGAPPVVGGLFFLAFNYGLVAHSKITIIDDKWAVIGSANVMRRSLYTDWEYSVAFLDENETAVRDFRSRLWAEHFKSPTPADFHDPVAALGGWEPAWNTTAAPSPAQPTRSPVDPGPPYLQPVTLPFPFPNPLLGPNQPLSQQVSTTLDTYLDVDSRQEWGGFCPPS